MLLNSAFRAALLLASSLPSAFGMAIPYNIAGLKSRALSTSPASVQTFESTNNAYPRVTALSDGTLLLGYAHNDGTTRALDILQSTDGGASFKPYGSVASRTDNADLDNIFLLEVGSTSPPTVLAAYRNHDKDSSGVYTYFRITVSKSTDGGKTWAFAGQATEFTAASTGGWGVWEPFMRIGSDGKVQLDFSKELAANNQQTYRTLSSNQGSSWSSPVNLLTHASNVNLRDGMVGIAKVTDQQDGRAALVIVFETTTRGDGIFNIAYAVSYDDGASYSSAGVVYMPSGTRQAGAPQIANKGTNGVAVVFMTDEGLSDQNWPTVAQIKTVTSDELRGGKLTWSSPQLVSSGSTYSHWPGVLSFSGKILSVYDQGGAIVAKYLSY
ncbi:hypothetical protein PFICI_12914 [Pestalotiopsis fici W106-1]|uniref:Sialidase domain-containing protein n=1 Tax=Pestalotiopsis fici (strain W106-1 / CGMCC3.15140) TaxID=1229662 RepID=W3WQ00_PESFW|nr:uncharacterized protein PFICI_12914 [Pestalotiopsis fici W106-1]ETS75970.1 hypothetical protein PFICI_12914 [Pestalotiopsis fici W106-1]